MLKLSLQAIKERPLFGKFRHTGQEIWVPRSLYLAEHIRLALTANRKGECTEACFATTTALLHHPVLGFQRDHCRSRITELDTGIARRIPGPRLDRFSKRGEYPCRQVAPVSSSHRNRTCL